MGQIEVFNSNTGEYSYVEDDSRPVFVEEETQTDQSAAIKKELADAYAEKAEEILSNPMINSISEFRAGIRQVFREVNESL